MATEKPQPCASLCTRIPKTTEDKKNHRMFACAQQTLFFLIVALSKDICTYVFGGHTKEPPVWWRNIGCCGRLLFIMNGTPIAGTRLAASRHYWLHVRPVYATYANMVLRFFSRCVCCYLLTCGQSPDNGSVKMPPVLVRFSINRNGRNELLCEQLLFWIVDDRRARTFHRWTSIRNAERNMNERPTWQCCIEFGFIRHWFWASRTSLIRRNVLFFFSECSIYIKLE